MRCEILRTPVLDFIHDRAAREKDPIKVPTDLSEGDVAELPEHIAEVLIAAGVAAKAAADKPAGKPAARPAAKAEAAHAPAPAKP